MDSNRFKKSGYEVVEWAVQYMQSMCERKVLPAVVPGYMRSLVPTEAPEKPETFDRVMRDLEPIILTGMVHWQHPQFFSYFASGNAWASVMGDIFSNATGVNGMSWASCPAVTELEIVVCDWFCKFLNLPGFFLSKFGCPESEGGGCVQHSASEAIFYSMMWAREDAIRKLRKKYPAKPRAVLLNMLVAYCNNECHSCVERGALIGCIHLRKLKPDSDGGITEQTLRDAITEDIEKGLIPFYHCAVIGSTGITCADDLMEVGPVCEEYGIWLHCDAAYAGAAFVNPEMRHLLAGYEYVWSTNVNTNKWMLCSFEASMHWVRYAAKAIDPMTGWEEDVWKSAPATGPDLRHWHVATTRRFRCFKLWCVIRNYGVSGLRRYTRNHINLTKLFEKYVKRDNRFEICGPVRFGLCAFRLKGLNEVTSRLLDAMNYSRRIHMVPSHFHDKVVIRFAVCSERACEEDIDVAWRTIDEFASVILRQYETEFGDDVAMQNLYKKQHDHDAHAALGPPDQRKSREEKEAQIALEYLERKMEITEDGLIKGVDLAAVNGAWDTSDLDKFKKFDENLHEHPELTEDVDEDADFVPRLQSMLHFSTINLAAYNHPDERESREVSEAQSNVDAEAPAE